MKVAGIAFTAVRYPITDLTAMTSFNQHIGIYAYQFQALKAFTQLERTDLEKLESLEQLRALYHQNLLELLMPS